MSITLSMEAIDVRVATLREAILIAEERANGFSGRCRYACLQVVHDLRTRMAELAAETTTDKG